jgi:3-methyladenine DNA glycosylase AlkD
MKHKFEFYGLKSPERKAIQKAFFLKNHLPDKNELSQITKSLWRKPQRELQYCAQELAFKYIKKVEENDIKLYEYMVTQKSWWDTVDFIASNLMGNYFKIYPHLRKSYASKWLASGNIWLQRSALLFQLKYKEDVDESLLSRTIHALLGSNEFFINKAIGWVLREYSKTNPEWVVAFTSQTKLHKLSKREALKWLKNKPASE